MFKNIKNTMMAPITHGITPPLAGLKAIAFKEAVQRVNTIQVRCVIFAKILKKAARLIATSALIEDDNGDIMMLNLYNYVCPKKILLMHFLLEPI